MILFLPAAALLLWFEYQGVGAIFHTGIGATVLLIGAGIVTTVPLILFVYAARNIPLTLLGILQYTTPTLNLLLGILVYGEEFPSARLMGFLLVWSGLVIYLFEGTVYRTRQKRRLTGEKL